jgi:hypothetical protein
MEMFTNPFINVLAAAILTGIILGAVNYFLAKKSGENIVSKRYIISFAIILLLYSGLFVYIQMSCDRKVTSYQQKMVRLKEEQKRRIKEIEAAYAKELALVEWKNKVFTSESEMKKSLAQAQTDYNLSAQEVSMWKGIAENNTLEKLIPKRNSKDVLNEYQNRLKNSLAHVRSGQTLMTSDIRMLADNINTIRLIGKEYEKVLGSFKDLYEQINSSSQSEMVMPKQKKFLFFPVKTKEYNKLLSEYYESKGNSKAMAEFSVKLKETIDKAEAEFAAINKRFNDNLSFLENTSNSISYNSDKLENLIMAAIDEANIINETDNKTNIKIRENLKN